MAVKINADTTNGLVITPDTSGELEFQSNGTQVLKVDSATGSLIIPSGTTAQRPASPSNGMIRFNTTTGEAEVYTASGGWVEFRKNPNEYEVQYLVVAGGGGGGGTNRGGGGGAGGLLYGTKTLVNSSSYTITVGAGGSGTTHNMLEEQMEVIQYLMM